MIPKEEVLKIVKKYLSERKRKYTSLDSIDKVGFRENKKILYGLRKGEKCDIFLMTYGEIWGNEERSMIVYVDANNGEVLYSISPHGWIEEIEDDID
jgi:hypothetical protein